MLDNPLVDNSHRILRADRPNPADSSLDRLKTSRTSLRVVWECSGDDDQEEVMHRAFDVILGKDAYPAIGE